MSANAVARVGDVGSHGNIMLGGSPNTFVNNRQIHRMYDLFVCPTHGIGATIGNCAPRVLVNNQQMAHVLSIGIDQQSAIIVQGSQNTFVGD